VGAALRDDRRTAAGAARVQSSLQHGLADRAESGPLTGSLRTVIELPVPLPDRSRPSAACRRARLRHHGRSSRIGRGETEATGVTGYSAIAETLNARGMRTAREGSWHATTVRNLATRRAA